MMVYLELLYVFFKIGLLGFGGGYAMLSLIQFVISSKQLRSSASSIALSMRRRLAVSVLRMVAS